MAHYACWIESAMQAHHIEATSARQAAEYAVAEHVEQRGLSHLPEKPTVTVTQPSGHVRRFEVYITFYVSGYAKPIETPYDVPGQPVPLTRTTKEHP